MLFSLGYRLEAQRDAERQLSNALPEEQQQVTECLALLLKQLRYDAHLLGNALINDPTFRRHSCGPVRVFYPVRLEDRYVDVLGFGRNVEWEP